MAFVRSLVLVSSLALAACAADSSPSSRGCTDIGCVDGVSVDLGPLSTRFPGTSLTVHVCLDAACQDAIVTASDCQQVAVSPSGPTPSLVLLCTPGKNGGVAIVASVPGGIPDGGSPTVAVSISDATGALLYEHTQVVGLGSSQPNGPSCEPICHEGSLSLMP